MISVIVPTMWLGKEFAIMLPKLLDHDKIGEVIIVDNDPYIKDLAAPWFASYSSNPKIKLIELEENIYVNPAWNLGVEKSQFDKLCIMNDDIEFDMDVFNLIYDSVTEQNGLIGPNGENKKHFYLRSPDMKLSPCNKITDGYGTLMFIHKKNYIKIPDEFKLDYGDVLIYDYNAVQKRQNYIIDKFCVKTKMRTTSAAPSFMEMRNTEAKIQQEVFTKTLKSKVKKGKWLSKPISYNA
jgi:Glycosyl transferase family 2